MKRVLITGAGGFIGSHLVELCEEQGFLVKAFVHYNSMNKWGWLDEYSIKDKVEVVSGDIRDYDSVFSAMKGCDTVFHLAALIGIPYSYISPLAYIKTNIEGTYNVLQSARELDLKNILITSTSETYGTAQYIPIDEKHPLVGQSPYSATKIGADHLAGSFYRSFGLSVKIVRPFNTYGPRQSARAVIPTVITQILNGEKQIRLGNLSPTRDFTYVKDTVSGFLEIARSKELIGEVTNIGTNSEISIGGVVQFIAELLGKKVKIECDIQRVRVDNSEVERLRCDNKKIKGVTDWRPLYSFEKGIKETIKWIKEHLTAYKVEIYNV